MNKSVIAEAEKRNPLLYLFSKTWRYSEGNHKNVVLYWCMCIVANTINLMVKPLTIACVINTIQKEGITEHNIPSLCGLLLLTLVSDIVFWAFHGPARVIECVNAFMAKGNYRKYLLKGVMSLPMSWHADHHSGDTVDKVEKGTMSLMHFSEESFQVIASIVQLVVSFIMLAYFSGEAACIVLIMVVIAMWITMRFDRVLIVQYKELNRAENNISESVYDTIGNITTVIILRVERLVFKAIAEKIQKPLELLRKNNKINEVKWFLTNMCCTIMVIMVMSMYFYQNIGVAQGLLIGNIYLLLKYLDKISELFFRFAGMYSDILKHKARIMNAEQLAEDFVPEGFVNHVLPPTWQRISIEGLTFSYHNDAGADLHLRDISLSIVRGERIAFVGRSGSGKTTLLKIIRNLHQPSIMKLVVDGQVIPQGFEGISQDIALIPQVPEIFSTTVRENITLGAVYSDDTIKHYTDLACFTDVIKGLPKGLDSAINEKGVNLSVGQQQRLALARGLLACEGKSIVLVDEPTSSLDPANEVTVYENLFREFRDKAVISTIHGLHLLPLFDRIYMFEAGKIVGVGSLGELLKTCPQFKILWRKYSEQKHNAAHAPEQVPLAVA